MFLGVHLSILNLQGTDWKMSPDYKMLNLGLKDMSV